MGAIKYLGNKSWSDITREERYFCSHLYHSVLGKEKEFIKWLSNIAKIEIDFQKDWEISFEVCFYRDFLKAQDKSVKTYKRINDLYYSQKRTFDLCLFAEDEIIIIEAKAQQGFTGHQLDEILQDADLVEELTKAFGIGKKARVILLHSSYYHPRDERIIKFPRFTWEDFCAFQNENNEVFQRADKLYKEDSLE